MKREQYTWCSTDVVNTPYIDGCPHHAALPHQRKANRRYVVSPRTASQCFDTCLHQLICLSAMLDVCLFPSTRLITVHTTNKTLFLDVARIWFSVLQDNYTHRPPAPLPPNPHKQTCHRTNHRRPKHYETYEGWNMLNTKWTIVNLLKPTGHVMHQQFNIQQLYALLTLYLCLVFIWEQTATCATYSINWLVFITEMKSVYSAVRTGSLNKSYRSRDAPTV